MALHIFGDERGATIEAILVPAGYAFRDDERPTSARRRTSTAPIFMPASWTTAITSPTATRGTTAPAPRRKPAYRPRPRKAPQRPPARSWRVFSGARTARRPRRDPDSICNVRIVGPYTVGSFSR